MSRSLLSSPSFLMSLLLKSHTSLKISIPSHRPCVSPSSSPVSLSRRSSFLSQFRFLSFFLTPLSLNRSLLLLSRSPFSPPLVNSSSSSLVHISPVTFPASSSLSLFSPPSSSSLPSFFLFKEGPSSSSLAEKSQRREKERKEERDEGNFPPFLKKKKKTSDGNRSLVFFTPSLALRDSPQNKEEEERKISSEDKKKDCIFEERRKKESEESGSFLLSERTTIEDTMEGSAPSSPSYMGGFDPKDRGQAGEVVLVPTLSDNYAYLLIDRETKDAACVDPAEPRKVLEAVKKEGVNLKMCLCTHKHLDHSGGNMELRDLCPGIEMVGSAYEETPGISKRVKHGDVLHLGGLKIEVMHAPCHTGGHVLYYVTSTTDPNLSPILFTGDTLFVGGCGRFFEGTASQMYHALLALIAPLPSHTKIYCGHEYTLANLQFALKVEPENEDLQAKYRWAVAQREARNPTIPSSIAQEKKFNPFMRVNERSIQEAVGSVGDEIQTLHKLREWKNKP